MGINKAYGTKITLGSSWIIGHDIIFDRDHKVIGIAEANCYQNTFLNLTNGLELSGKEISKLSKEYQNNIQRDKYINKWKITIIFIGIICFFIIIIIIFLVIKCNKQKYLTVSLEESNKLDII